MRVNSSFKVKVLVILCFVMFCGFLTACGESSGSAAAEEHEDGEIDYEEVGNEESTEAGYFQVIESGDSGKSNSMEKISYRILVDPKTNVMYYETTCRSSYKGGISITPLYNADGTLKIYQE